MPIFLLPRLSANAPITPVRTGEWEKAGVSDRFLKGLANGLAVAANEDNTGRINTIDSIPDIWARPIFFQMALYAGLNNTHQNFDAALHEKAKGEWRSILAMLALKDMRHLNLTAEAVNLDRNNPGDQLEKILLTMAPKNSITGNNSDWSDIYVFSYNDKLLAITSPTTLVAPAADYSTELAGDLTEPWSSDGRYLTDPIPYLAPDELNGLHLWLEKLEGNLINTIPLAVQQDNEVCTQLLEALDKYKSDVRAKAGNNFAKTGNIISAGLNTHIGIFSFLDNMIQPPVVTAKGSAVSIRTSAARQNAKPLLLVSPQMLKDLSVSRRWPLAQFFVWPGLTAININEQSLSGSKTMINNVSLVNAEWRRPEEFFTKHLLIYEGGNAFKNILKVRGSDALSQNDDMSVILPLRQEILDYFTPEEIANRFYIEKVGNEFKVQFTFPLSGKDGNGIEYKVEKSYQESYQEVIYLMNDVPVIEIWPNFKRPGWNKYYLYYENSEAQNSSNVLGRDFFYVYPWAYEINVAGDTPNRGLSNLYVAKLSGFPEALICTVNLSTDDGVNARNLEAGIILLSEPKSAPAQMGKVWKLGIDFGTSSTMIYHREGTHNPQPLVLQPNLFQVTDSGDKRNRTYLNFIPSSTPDHQAGSFLSIFHLLNNAGKRDTDPIRPLQDGNVFRLSSGDGKDAEDFCANSGQIDANLKWKDTSLNLKKVEAYIKQICLQSLAEAAKNGAQNVSWDFSYPTAFSALQQTTFEATCNAAVVDALNNSGFKHGNVDHWPESKAATYYFSQLGTHLASGAVCLDIGAGTTDISVISGLPPKIVYHTSLQFAGRYLFQSLYKHYEVFANTPLQFGNMEEEQRNALIDADMRKHSSRYLSNLRTLIVQDEIQKMLQTAQYATAGIFYYLGGLIGLLHDRNIYKENNIPEIYIGGNGSRIFSWICGGTFNSNNRYMQVFKDMFVDASGLSLDFDFNLVLSSTPKIEVAHGMVGDKPPHHATFFDPHQIAVSLFGANGHDPLIANSVFAGDVFVLGNEVRKKSEFISAYDIQQGVRIRDVNELKTFTEKFNANYNDIWRDSQRIEISDNQMAGVSRAVLGVYANQMGRPPRDIFVEPVFILELKKFMEML